MKKIILLLFLGLIFGITSVACEKSFYSGTTQTGFAHFPKSNNISPEKALELAGPYLTYSYELRKKNLKRKYNVSHTIFEHVILKGDFYFVARDDEPNKFLNFYIPYSVKINKNTGEVIKPDEKTATMAQYKNF